VHHHQDLISSSRFLAAHSVLLALMFVEPILPPTVLELYAWPSPLKYQLALGAYPPFYSVGTRQHSMPLTTHPFLFMAKKTSLEMETVQDWWTEADKLKIIILLLLLLSLLALFYSTLFTILKISRYNTNVHVHETVCQQIYMFNCLPSFLSNMCTLGSPHLFRYW